MDMIKYLNEKKRIRLDAILTAFFGGAFGLQKFYLGKTTQGILCVLFFWTFIPAIIGCIEAIYYLSMSDKTFDRKYNS